ncbi:MAG: 1-acyl-sn-glycerol-3-phosphate acyltransferase [Firmicutes bacterium]|nr:1-acyl-sn-glycerol-3-phosphate acyltransferase [Bacillota bacterium]
MFRFIKWLFRYTMWFVVHIPFRLLFPTRIVNRKRFLTRKSIIFGNHTSGLDPVLLWTRLLWRTYFIAKKELFKGWFLGGLGILKTLGAFPVNRQGTDIEAVKTGLKVLRRGFRLVLFPEGTRKAEGSEMGEVKNGVAMFALKTQTLVTPVFILRKPKMFRRNRFFVGKPISLEHLYDRRVNKETIELASVYLTEKFNELRTESLEFVKRKNPRLYKKVVLLDESPYTESAPTNADVVETNVESAPTNIESVTNVDVVEIEAENIETNADE